MRKGIDYTGITTVFFCHDGGGNILMGKRSQNCRDEQGRWDIGGGSLEFGLSIEENLKKEIQEEYCATIINYTLLGHRNVLRELGDGTKTHWIAFEFAVHIDRSTVKNGEPESIDEIGWFTLDSLPDPVHSQFPKTLALHKKKLVEIIGQKRTKIVV